MDSAVTWAQQALPDAERCRAAALAAAGGAVEEGATWPYCWPGGERLALDLANLTQHLPRHTTVVDLGCGRGLLGMVAIYLGFNHVTFADGDPLPLTLLAESLSPYPHSKTALVNWGQAVPGGRAELLLGGDVLYRPQYHDHLLATIAESLSDQGCAYLGDPRSQIEADFASRAQRHGLHCHSELRPGPYTLCTLRRR